MPLQLHDKLRIDILQCVPFRLVLVSTASPPGSSYGWHSVHSRALMHLMSFDVYLVYCILYLVSCILYLASLIAGNREE